MELLCFYASNLNILWIGFNASRVSSLSSISSAKSENSRLALMPFKVLIITPRVLASWTASSISRIRVPFQHKIPRKHSFDRRIFPPFKDHVVDRDIAAFHFQAKVFPDHAAGYPRADDVADPSFLHLFGNIRELTQIPAHFPETAALVKLVFMGQARSFRA